MLRSTRSLPTPNSVPWRSSSSPAPPARNGAAATDTLTTPPGFRCLARLSSSPRVSSALPAIGSATITASAGSASARASTARTRCSTQAPESRI